MSETKYCEDCKYYRTKPNSGSHDGAYYATCAHPQATQRTTDMLVSRQFASQATPYCTTMRSGIGKCGTGGRLFETVDVSSEVRS